MGRIGSIDQSRSILRNGLSKHLRCSMHECVLSGKATIRIIVREWVGRGTKREFAPNFPMAASAKKLWN